jgi:hypothetical protein
MERVKGIEPSFRGVLFIRGEGRFSTNALKSQIMRKSLEARVGIGRETQIWNRIVRIRFPKWVSRNAFILAEMNLNKIPANLMTLEFVDQINPEILLEHWLD